MPEGLASTLIHFAPLLTTTFPCGQYFFFEIWKPGNQEGGERRLIRPILRFQILRETFSHRISPPVSADRASTAAHQTSYPDKTERRSRSAQAQSSFCIPFLAS